MDSVPDFPFPVRVWLCETILMVWSVGMGTDNIKVVLLWLKHASFLRVI